MVLAKWKVFVVLLGCCQGAQLESDGGFRNGLKCLGCRAAVGIWKLYHWTGFPPDPLFSFSTTICHLFGFGNRAVCDGMVRSLGPEILAILEKDKQGIISTLEVCEMAYPIECKVTGSRLTGWKLDIPDLEGSPPTEPRVWPTDLGVKKEKILHLSDVHLQLDYQVGANAECGLPLCCNDNKTRQGTYVKASKFGEYTCDLPIWMLDRFLADMKLNHGDIDYIFLTGDFPPHQPWKQTVEGNLAHVRTVADLVYKHFPSTPVLPNVGNHDTHPLNMFSGSVSSEELYQPMAAIYGRWLTDPEQQSTFKDGGYYSVLLRKGFRVISINTNFCNNLNFWLLLNFNDPHRHLQWLYMQLHQAERRRETVYVLGHITPGAEECLGGWSHQLNRIVHRFRNTIAGVFSGHDHLDDFEIVFGKGDDGERMPSGVVYVAPSPSPLYHVNPSYKVYTIDGVHPNTTNLLLDYDTYWMDLEKAKRTGETGFRHDCNVKADLGLENMSPEEWYSYVKRVVADEREFWKLRRRTQRYGRKSRMPCDPACKEHLLCSLVTADTLNRDSKECREIRAALRNQTLGSNLPFQAAK